MPDIIARRVRCELLVDINNIRTLDSIKIKGGQAIIGATVRQRDAERHRLLHQRHPLMIHILHHIGSAAVRNRGTLVGSLCQAEAWGELPLLFTLLGGNIVVQSLEGNRTLSADHLFNPHNCPALSPKEIVTEAHFTLPRATDTWGYCEYAHRAGDRALGLVGVVSQCDSQRRLVDIKIAVGGLTAFPQRFQALECLLLGESADNHLAEYAGEFAATQLPLRDDRDFSPSYRRTLLRTLVNRALRQSFSVSPLTEPS
ncbi:Carbon monoxide dehydrogenase medium chain [Serratia quinivorans]|nr:Carbon monoxide dehydrogenase medium chain [Serratia quinivorans]CAI2160076.1 Carbon monoxide dehydrogenase medium chain [Serratia quinivorans]